MQQAVSLGACVSSVKGLGSGLAEASGEELELRRAGSRAQGACGGERWPARNDPDSAISQKCDTAKGHKETVYMLFTAF